jgi:hypothetical protein
VPAEVRGLRVLVADVNPDAQAISLLPVDENSLRQSARPTTLVVRINGSKVNSALGIEAVVKQAHRWSSNGINVAGIEIDHDCATSRLASYASWLGTQRSGATGLKISITALPTWSEAAALLDIASSVDEIVVQVHAVKAPSIFESKQARRWLTSFAAAVPDENIRVALPTYSAMVAGQWVVADSRDVANFVADLRQHPISNVVGIVWFRLPISGDDQTWSTATWLNVIDGTAARNVPSIANARLIARGENRADVEISNDTDANVPLPTVTTSGDVTGREAIAGYSIELGGRWIPPHRAIAARTTQIIGWVTGKDLYVQAH